MYNKLLLTIIALICLNSNIFTQTVDVYVAGRVNETAAVWKNGQVTFLTDGINEAWAKSVYVSEENVYVVGFEYNTDGIKVAKLWKNGELTYLSSGSNEAIANSVFVSDNNVYVAGMENGKAVIWENGEITFLSDGSNEAVANSLFVLDNNVYVAGMEDGKAVIWKNGEITFLPSSESTVTSAESVFVSGEDIYVAGYEYNIYGHVSKLAKLWKNDKVFIDLTDGSREAGAHSVYVRGDDVYVIGYERNTDGKSVAKLWKNSDTSINITDGNNEVFANGLYVSGNDIYVAITEYVYPYTNATCWKNGERTQLTNRGEAISIFAALNTTGIPKTPNNEVKIYPNPTSNKVFIENKSNVKLYNLHGTLLHEAFCKEIDLSAYSQGIYFLNIDGNIVKIIKN